MQRRLHQLQAQMDSFLSALSSPLCFQLKSCLPIDDAPVDDGEDDDPLSAVFQEVRHALL